MSTEKEISEKNALDGLKAKAQTLGVSYSPNIGVEALIKKIDDRIKQNTEEMNPSNDPVMNYMGQNYKNSTLTPTKNLTDKDCLEMDDEVLEQYPEERRKDILRRRSHIECMALKRCQIFNNNPDKRELNGEIITISNSYIPTVRKFIPFGEAGEVGYHVPTIIYNHLKERQYQQIKVVKNADGTETIVTSLVPEFTIVDLPPLTKEELAELAKVQQASNRIG